MAGLLLQSILETRINFIIAAAGVCALTAATLILLMRNAEIASDAQRRFAAIWVAVVAGVGVWTTHFVAMIGYRPDAALTYDFGLTSLSIFVGIACVGLPIAASIFFDDRPLRTTLGALAGLGVAAMHMTGMSAIENCLATYNPVVLTLGVLLGVGGCANALREDSADGGSSLASGVSLVIGICALHFTAMASVELDLVPAITSGIGGTFLSIMVALVSLGVFTAAILATFNHRRALAMQRAGI
ncbi:MHYT domain-containing protein [Pseudooceanicola sp.]|uniref:MHYT domain-containing protein n=1 Tax=Pseudooceanicola sp. TaxID=1914328 RepID=UPI0035C6D476